MSDEYRREGTPEMPSEATGLGQTGHRRQLRLGGVQIAGLRRRPSGEKAPFPRGLKRSGRFWLLAGFAVLVL